MNMYGKVVALLLLLAGHLAGIIAVYDAGGDARETAVRLEYTDKENADLKAAQAEAERQAKENSRLSGELALAQADIRKRDSKINQLEHKYATLAQRGTDCNLTLGSVMLHNAALGYDYDPRELDAEGGAISTIGGAAFIEHCNRLGTAFELQRQQLNNLIEALP